jgi:hypothetical protein
MKRAASRRKVRKHKRHYFLSADEERLICNLYRGRPPATSQLSTPSIQRFLQGESIDVCLRTVVRVLERNGVARRPWRPFASAALHGRRKGQKGVLVPATKRGTFAFALRPAVEL